MITIPYVSMLEHCFTRNTMTKGKGKLISKPTPPEGLGWVFHANGGHQSIWSRKRHQPNYKIGQPLPPEPDEFELAIMRSESAYAWGLRK